MTKTNNTLTANAFLRVPTLDAATHAIESLEEASKTNGVKIAAILANVERDSLYKDGDFKSTRAYAKETFGYKDTYITNLLNIGLKLLDADGVPQLPGGEKWTAGQLESVIPVGIETAVKMAEDGVITPDMTAKEVREAVSQHRDEYQSTNTENKKTTVLRQYDGYVKDGNGIICFGFVNQTLDGVEAKIFNECEKAQGEDSPVRLASKNPDGSRVVLMLYPSGRMYSYTYEPHAKTDKKPATTSNRDAMAVKMKAAGYTDSEIGAFMKMFDAANAK